MIYLFLNHNQITKSEKVQNHTICLDENKNAYYNENIGNNIKEGQLKMEKEKEISEEKNQVFAIKKRIRKIKKFISCKKI